MWGLRGYGIYRVSCFYINVFEDLNVMGLMAFDGYLGF